MTTDNSPQDNQKRGFWRSCMSCLTKATIGLTLVILAITWWPLTEKDNRSIFEKFLGIPLTSQIKLISLERRGGFDFLHVHICFEASRELLREMVVAKSLPVTKTRRGAPGCFTKNGETFGRLAGPGGGRGEYRDLEVHGFSSTDEFLVYDPRSRRGSYTFNGID